MAERLLRKEGMLKKTTEWIVIHKYPESEKLPKEEFEHLCAQNDVIEDATFKLNLLDLQDRLFEEYHETKSIWACRDQAEKWLTTSPRELLINIEEWLDGKSLSDIELHGISINYILEKYKYKKVSFINAVEFFIAWKKMEYLGKGFHKVYFSRGF